MLMSAARVGEKSMCVSVGVSIWRFASNQHYMVKLNTCHLQVNTTTAKSREAGQKVLTGLPMFSRQTKAQFLESCTTRQLHLIGGVLGNNPLPLSAGKLFWDLRPSVDSLTTKDINYVCSIPMSQQAIIFIGYSQ